MTGILLDTNVVSEIAKTLPDARVIAFLNNVENAFLSVVTLHELHYGISRHPVGRRRSALFRTIDRIVSDYDDAIIGIQRGEARRAGELRAAREAGGRAMHLADALIAATALEHGLELASRNVADFSDVGLTVVDPWQA